MLCSPRGLENAILLKIVRPRLPAISCGQVRQQARTATNPTKSVIFSSIGPHYSVTKVTELTVWECVYAENVAARPRDTVYLSLKNDIMFTRSSTLVEPKWTNCHMAEGYARSSGKPGVVPVTSGPGATNVITPMAGSLADGTSMVVFTGQVSTTAIGSNAFQEADAVGISRGCTKWDGMVQNMAELPKQINEAFEIAASGRPSPVLVDLSGDITGGFLRKAIPTESTFSPATSAVARQAVELQKKQVK
ncbi:Acetolactate synthase, mitochondrial [Aspergillus alliaceus]|uniref:Acetolactate synthase, mitochondrial n=1 Tax=Petromyces alliaceus TaxID=209559 RepID=A0A8H5ZRF8_PETAA|nr:Acetolactate synthase, mitochondrial [Aspergillus burnettii]